MLAKEGMGFREEVQDFVSLSPRTAVEYHLQRFRAYNAIRRKKVLTEETVLSAPLRIQGGVLDPLESGVGVTPLAPSTQSVCAWLRGYAARVKSAAQARSQGGVAALAVVHPDGVEVNGFGVRRAFFAHDPKPPITQVIVLLAGQRGFGPGVLGLFEEALMGRVGEKGCDVGPLRLNVSSSGRANAALGDLFMHHDRAMLVPILEATFYMMNLLGWLRLGWLKII